MDALSDEQALAGLSAEQALVWLAVLAQAARSTDQD